MRPAHPSVPRLLLRLTAAATGVALGTLARTLDAGARRLLDRA